MSGKFKHSRVLFLGGESSGKSTITIEAAKATDSLYAHEFGRQFYEERPNKKYEFDDLAIIASTQNEIEIEVLQRSYANENRYSFYDTSMLVTYFYSMEWFGKSSPSLKNYALPILESYEFIFLCQNDFPFVQDGSRQSLEFSKKQYEFYKFVLDRMKIPYTILTGTVENRLNSVLHTIGAKYADQKMAD